MIQRLFAIDSDGPSVPVGVQQISDTPPAFSGLVYLYENNLILGELFGLENGGQLVIYQQSEISSTRMEIGYLQGFRAFADLLDNPDCRC